MSGYIKYFDDGGKNMSFVMDDKEVYKKYNEKTHYTCISAIDIDSVLKIDKRACLQAYLEQCKYKLKKRKRSRYIDHLEIIDYDSENDSDSDSIMLKLKMMIKLKMLNYLDNHRDHL